MIIIRTAKGWFWGCYSIRIEEKQFIGMLWKYLILLRCEGKKYSVWNIIIANCWRDKFMEWNEKWFMLGFIERKCFKKKILRMMKKLWTHSFRRKYITKSNKIFSFRILSLDQAFLIIVILPECHNLKQPLF